MDQKIKIGNRSKVTGKTEHLSAKATELDVITPFISPAVFLVLKKAKQHAKQ